MRTEPVVVEWWDAHGATDGWTARDDIDTARRVIRTAGYLIAKDRSHLTVAQSIDDATDHVDHVLKIPRPVVLRVRRLDARTYLWPRWR